MMMLEWTPAVNRTLLIADQWARHLSAPHVEALHVLLALIQDEEGRPALLLREQGVGLEAIRDCLASGKNTLRMAELAPDGDRATLSALTQSLLASARQLAVELAGEATVASEHLLMAVLHHDAAICQRLAPIGLDVPKLETRMRLPTAARIEIEEPLVLSEPTEQIDAARILDANANRAREALRVIEDFCRFVLDDVYLSGELKRLRHDLVTALSSLPSQRLLEARDTPHDVGTTLRTPTEERRYSASAVAQANLKRLQESLRSLEEYGKLQSPTLGRDIESIRYRAYTVERALVLGSLARQRLVEARLYILVSGSACAASVEWTIKEAVAGGAQVIQLREKKLNDGELLQRARNVRRWTREAGALFIMNDRPDIARLSEADGVHVGQEELGVKDVRRIAGPDMLIGVSTHDIDQARQAISDGASYIGVGPTFPSGTKEFGAFAGLDLVRQVAAETSLPAFAIGGITLENVHQVVEAGLRRVAVSQAICQADDPGQVAAAFRAILTQNT